MRVCLFVSALVLAACGGTSEDDPGTGGAAGTAGSAGSGGTGGTAGNGGGSGSGGSAGNGGGSAGSGATAGSGGTAGASGSAGAGGAAGADCKALGESMQKTLAEAVTCSPMLTVEQCTGSATGFDQCGCEVVLNETQPAKVKAANDTYSAWVAAGCGPFGCGAPCFFGTKGTCDAATSTCQWAP